MGAQASLLLKYQITLAQNPLQIAWSLTTGTPLIWFSSSILPAWGNIGVRGNGDDAGLHDIAGFEHGSLLFRLWESV